MTLTSDSMKLVPYQTIVEPKEYWNLSVILLVIGFFLLSYFFIYQVTYRKAERSLTKEVLIGLFASTFLASGTTFMFLGVGLYF